MPTPSHIIVQLSASATIAATVKAAEVIREPELNAKTRARSRTTNKKLYNQLQNSLWLRNCSGRIAFMLYCQLQNSTKFHFGNTITNKSPLRITRHEQERNRHQHKSKNQQKQLNICNKHCRFGIRKGNNIVKDTTDLIQAKDNGTDIGGATEKEGQLLSKWIHSSSSASSGTVIPPTWQ